MPMTHESTEPPSIELLPAEAVAAAAAFARTYGAWTWPELVAAIRTVLPESIATVVTSRLLDIAVHEPRHPADALVQALAPWIIEAPTPRPAIEPAGPSPTQSLPDDLPDIYDVEQLAHWLDFTIEELEWFADRGGWLRKAREPLRHYRVWRREKRDGVRVIEAPKPRLRETQRRLLRRLVQRIPAHDAARGFMPGSSTAAFAWPHSDRPTVLRVDLRHCFETISAARVRAVFADAGYQPHIARILAELCTTATPPDRLAAIDAAHAALLRARHLPQGAPTSPHLANLVMRSLDRRLAGYARRHDLHYTRYGDDLAISGDMSGYGAAPTTDRVLWTVARVVESEGFTVHPDKVRVMHAHQQQRLTGLVVNDRPRVSRADYDSLRALLHNAIRHGAASQNRDGHTDFRAHVYGRIAWVGETGTQRRERLRALAEQVDWQS